MQIFLDTSRSQTSLNPGVHIATQRAVRGPIPACLHVGDGPDLIRPIYYCATISTRYGTLLRLLDVPAPSQCLQGSV